MRGLFFILFTFISIFSTAQTQTKTILTTDQVELVTSTKGKGPVCIYVHGGPGMWSKSFEDLGGNKLEEKLQMIYFDQRGSGRSSSASNGDYSLDRMIEDIEEVRKAYQVDKIYLMGHSFGGILITNYAKKYPQHLEGLILLNATLSIKASMKAQIEYVNKTFNESFSTNEVDLMDNFGNARYAIGQKNLDYTFLTASKINYEYLNKVDEAKPQQYDFASKAFNIPEYLMDYTGITSQIKVPTLVIAGTEDYAIGVEHYKSFQFPNQKIKLIKGGHILYYEQNDLFLQTVYDFIQP